jgi:hypothetical protein
MSRERTSQHMVVLGYSITCGVGNDTEVDESGLFRSAPPSLLPVIGLLHAGFQLRISVP